MPRHAFAAPKPWGATLLLAGAFLLDSPAASAQTFSGAPAHAVDWREGSLDGSDEHLVVGEERYSATVGGLRTYVDSLREKDPELYRVLDDEVSSLETRRVVGYSIAGVGVASGLGLGIAGYVLNTNDKGNDDRLGTGLFVGGISLLIAGPLIGALVLPGRGSISDVIDVHNGKSPTPLRWSVDIQPSTGAWEAAASVVF